VQVGEVSVGNTLVRCRFGTGCRLVRCRLGTSCAGWWGVGWEHIGEVSVRNRLSVGKVSVGNILSVGEVSVKETTCMLQLEVSVKEHVVGWRGVGWVHVVGL